MIEAKASVKCLSIATLSVFFTTATPSLAKDVFRQQVLDECPVTSTIRMANASPQARSTALAGCSDRIVAVPTPPVTPGPDIVRIIGVKEDPDADSGRRRSSATPSSFVTYSSPRVAPAAFAWPAASRFDAAIGEAASRHRIDPLFLHAVIATESAYRADAVSRVGARGLMQIMPATGRGLGVAEPALFDPGVNIDAGARHLKRLQRRYGTNFELILSAYNAGEGAVARYGNRVPPYRETRNYVARVMARYHQLRDGTGPVR